MKYLYNKLTLVACALAAGCASVPEYEPPPLAGNSVFQYSARNYKIMQFFENGDDCTKGRRFKETDNPFLNPDRPVTIASNKQVAVTLVWSGITHTLASCHVTLSFKPQPNGRYRLVGSGGPEGCTAQIIDLVVNRVADPASINLVQMRKNSPLGYLHEGCVPVQ